MNTNDFITLIKRMPRALIGAVLISVFSVIATVLVIVFLLLPAQKNLATARTVLTEKATQDTRMKNDIAHSAELTAATAKLETERDEFVKNHTLVPLLSSMSMRAKTILNPIAEKTGFVIETVRELPILRLQTPKTLAEQLYSREPIEFSGRGTFEQISAFIARTEAEHPYTILSGLVIAQQPNTPEVHRAIVTFEWPITGEKRTAAPAAKKN